MLDFFLGYAGSAPLGASTLNGLLLLIPTIIAVIIGIVVNVRKKNGLVTVFCTIGFTIYISLLIEIVFFPIPFVVSEFDVIREYSSPIINLIPFVDIFNANSAFLVVKNLIGNVILFVPLGFGVRFFATGKKSYKKSVLIILLSALMIEIIQFFGSFIIYKLNWKIVDIDDLIMNIVGGLIGMGIYYLLDKIVSKSKHIME